MKKARLSSEAIAKSFNIHNDEARTYLAIALGKKDWISLCAAIEKNTDSPSELQLALLHEEMMMRLAHHIDVEPTSFLLEVIKSTSPFSNKPKPLTYDIKSVRHSPEGAINLAEMFEEMGGNSGMEDFLRDMLSQSPNFDEDMIEELFGDGQESFADRMRMSKPMEPYYYLVAIDYLLGWKTSDQSHRFEHGEPVFHWYDQNDEENPVFLNGAVIFAGDTGDTNLLNTLQNMVEDSTSPFEKPILLFGNVAYKEIAGKEFATIGIWHDGSDWRWLFLSKLPPEEQARIYPESKLDNLENSLLVPPPHNKLAVTKGDNGLPTHLLYHCIVSPSKKPTESHGNQGFVIEPRQVMSSHSGWNIYI